MNKKFIKSMCLGLSVLVLAGCNPGGVEGIIIDSNHPYADYFEGMEYKKTYNAFLPEAIKKSLNYLKYNDGALAKHWANFVDGLLLQNEFGVLEKQLATSATQENYNIFKFDVKEDVKWMTYKGEQYHNAEHVAQYVSAEDFVTSAEAVLNANNASDLVYLYANFIEGAVEYNQFTKLKKLVMDGTQFGQAYKTIPAFTKELNKRIKAETGKPSTIPATKEALKDINDFKNVGVHVSKNPKSNGGGQVTYTLKEGNQAVYFPTLLAYSCYLPMNKFFLDDKGFTKIGETEKDLLYCGPFILSESTGEKVVYTKNPAYHKDNVYIDTINYRVFGSNDNPATARQEFEAGNVDAFGITKRDKEGWEKYIKGGPNGTGTLENPANGYVNSRDYNYIDYVYGLQINVDRASSNSKTSYATTGPKDAEGNPKEIRNASKALKLREVRELVLESFSVIEHNKRYAMDGSRPGQYQMNTFIPKGFVQDKDGNDYTTTHYYKEYQKQEKAKGNVLTDEQVAEKLAQGQTNTYIQSQKEINKLRVRALDAIKKYNENPEFCPTEADKITLPVQIEMFSEWTDAQVKGFDVPLFREMNRRINNNKSIADFNRTNTVVKGEGETSTGGFLIIPTYDVSPETNRDKVTNGGNWDIACMWGWGPDYGDPMSYMNTYAIHGDWSNILKFVNNEVTDNYYLDKDGNLVKNNLLGAYDAKVKAADAVQADTNKRFALFAEAEYMLINELQIFKPMTMTGQGRQASVSRAAGYKNPQGSYGLAKDRNDGLIVLVEAITGEQRKSALAKYEAAKKAYVDNHDPINIYSK